MSGRMIHFLVFKLVMLNVYASWLVYITLQISMVYPKLAFVLILML
jgi:hypothetical protein